MTPMYRIATLTVLFHLSFAGARVTLSLFALKLGASPFTVGAVISMVAVVPMLFSITWGRYVDRVGVRVPMHIGTAASLAGLALALAVPRMETLYVSGALVGSGFYLSHIAVSQASGLIGKPEERVRNFTLLALAFSAASFLGPVIAGLSIDAIGHRLTFCALAMPLLAVIAIMLVQPLAVPRPTSARKDAGEKRIADLIRMPAMRRVFVVSGMLSIAWDLFSFVMPIHGSNLGLSASTVGLILGAFGAAVFIVRLALPLLFRRASEWNLLIGAMFLSGAVLGVMPFVTEVPLLIALAFVLGIGLGGAQPMIMSLIYDRAPQGRAAEALGVRTLLINFSQTGIPLMFGAVGAALGMAPVFWTIALALVSGGWYARRP
jgi:MFS family permease